MCNDPTQARRKEHWVDESQERQRWTLPKKNFPSLFLPLSSVEIALCWFSPMWPALVEEEQKKGGGCILIQPQLQKHEMEDLNAQVNGYNARIIALNKSKTCHQVARGAWVAYFRYATQLMKHKTFFSFSLFPLSLVRDRCTRILFPSWRFWLKEKQRL